ncbi:MULTISPECIES: hypothetical protein [unclassified Haematospirillum]|uniref:hypothetical protein n=1 Tax=unclassified Haematospirillum TaxID=2622088 RepID=UPI00143A5EC7|nr:MULTISPECIES: hypothetical protein [unclassified Haematospirillum]NKD55379.1 hypothetical protein [Haematospirillum sp. H4890]NKD75493.1 hypothetical protein [Haematospirillum sp. H4485]NKD87782.1 hypothetical protein [Haematospirillum sp. 15-248]
MPPKNNPLKLNSLQLKTLTLLQVLAGMPDASQPDPETGDPMVTAFPDPHGNHFHLGSWVVSSSDATGLRNEAVWKALTRKGLAMSRWPYGISVTAPGMTYETGLKSKILHGSDH